MCPRVSAAHGRLNVTRSATRWQFNQLFDRTDGALFARLRRFRGATLNDSVLWNVFGVRSLVSKLCGQMFVVVGCCEQFRKLVAFIMNATKTRTRAVCECRRARARSVLAYSASEQQIAMPRNTHILCARIERSTT